MKTPVLLKEMHFAPNVFRRESNFSNKKKKKKKKYVGK